MENKLIIQRSKSDPRRKAIVSLILGITAVISGPILHFLSLIGAIPLFSSVYGYYGAFPIAIFGLIFGIIGLKSTKKSLAIGGMVLNVIIISLSILLIF